MFCYFNSFVQNIYEHQVTQYLLAFYDSLALHIASSKVPYFQFSEIQLISFYFHESRILCKVQKARVTRCKWWDVSAIVHSIVQSITLMHIKPPRCVNATLYFSSRIACGSPGLNFRPKPNYLLII